MNAPRRIGAMLKRERYIEMNCEEAPKCIKVIINRSMEFEPDITIEINPNTKCSDYTNKLKNISNTSHIKAWQVSDECDEYSTVVFAETRNKAKMVALTTDCCEYMDYIRINPQRFKEADIMYKGHNEMDWSDPEDRRFLCEHGWSCVEMIIEDCQDCPCNDVCDKYNDYKDDLENEYDS